jgi:hypothetical protein
MMESPENNGKSRSGTQAATEKFAEPIGFGQRLKDRKENLQNEVAFFISLAKDSGSMLWGGRCNWRPRYTGLRRPVG